MFRVVALVVRAVSVFALPAEARVRVSIPASTASVPAVMPLTVTDAESADPDTAELAKLRVWLTAVL
jgi:hypothetical protein